MDRLTCAPLPQFPPDGAEAAIGIDPVQRPRVVAGERRLGQHSGDALFRQPTGYGSGNPCCGAGCLDPGARPVTLLWLLTSLRQRLGDSPPWRRWRRRRWRGCLRRVDTWRLLQVPFRTQAGALEGAVTAMRRCADPQSKGTMQCRL